MMEERLVYKNQTPLPRTQYNALRCLCGLKHVVSPLFCVVPGIGDVNISYAFWVC
jgi:hypothetical protein